MNGSVNAWLVHLSGYVSIDGVYGSYGCICSTDYSKFFQNYWWLRSPCTSWDGSAHCVRPDGDIFIDNDVDYSYGHSPSTYSSSYACLVFPGGDVDAGDGYGGVRSSYGIISPVTNYFDIAYFINPSGDVINSGSYNVFYSYGRNLAVKIAVHE